MRQSPIIEQSQRYPTQAEIQAAMERAHELRAATFSSALGALARVFRPSGSADSREIAVRAPQPARPAHC